jgi:hypothetical protein
MGPRFHLHLCNDNDNGIIKDNMMYTCVRMQHRGHHIQMGDVSW